MPWFQTPSPAAVTEFGLTGSPGWIGYDLDDTAYRQAFTYFVGLGYQLVDLWGYSQGDFNTTDTFYAALWQECHAQPAQYSQHAIAFDEFQSTFDTESAAGYGPIRICGYTAGSVTLFAAIWVNNGKAAWAANHLIDLSDLDSHVQEVVQMDYRITDLSAYLVLQANPADPSGEQTWVAKFSSISVPSDGRAWMINDPVPLDNFQDYLSQQQSRGWHPVQLSGFGGNVQVIGRWEQLAMTANVGQSSIGVQAFTSFLTTTGNAIARPKSIGAYNQMVSTAPPPFTQYSPNYCTVCEMRFDSKIIPELAAEFLRNYNIPGLSLAVARQGQLVYAGGFGTADKSTGEQVQTTSRFRIASLSKAITATMIFLLVDQNKLSLDDVVFGPAGRLYSLGLPVDQRVNEITIHQLLQHAGGGWANDANDPMYTYPDLFYPGDLIRKVIATRSLDHDPGTAYAYSNFGYCALGRVIESIFPDQNYEYPVQNNVLKVPCGADSMMIGGNTLAERQADEVVYYGTTDGDPYGFLLSRMDSHGGWVGTATDYLRFMVRVDGLTTVPDLLSSSSMTLMTTASGLPDPTNNNQPSTYACGWVVGTDGTWSHTGDLAGTRSIMVRTADGYCWVALVNSGTTASGDPTSDTLSGLDALMWAIRDRVDLWGQPSPL